MHTKDGRRSLDTHRTDNAPPANEIANAGPIRVIARLPAFAIVAGSMLGIGVFLSPPIVAKYVPSAEGFFVMWLLGGLVALAGAVACGELGTMMPRAGGDYVFQYEAFGPSVAFASGWVLFGAIFCGSIATLAVGLCTYQVPALTGIELPKITVDLPFLGAVSGAQLAALLLVVVITAVNAHGALLSARTQAVLSMLPITVLAPLAVYAIVTGDGAEGRAVSTRAVAESLSFGGLATAYLATYFAYSGWISIIYVAGEVQEPQRNIPFALIGGTVAVTALYLLLCTCFMRVLGLGGLIGAGEAGSATATVLAGNAGRLTITFLIGCALLACTNATVLGGARVAYAMGERGAAWSWLAHLDSRYFAPQRALWVQASLACLLIVTGTFEMLYTMVSLAMVVTGTLTVAALFLLRRTRPHASRPYRATGYPLLPGIYVVSSVLVISVMLGRAMWGGAEERFPILGLGVLALAYVGHRVFAVSRR